MIPKVEVIRGTDGHSHSSHADGQGQLVLPGRITVMHHCGRSHSRTIKLSGEKKTKEEKIKKKKNYVQETKAVRDKKQIRLTGSCK